MFKKIALTIIVLLFLLLVSSSISNATIYVPSYGETGWQTWTMTFDSDFSGTAGIGVSNEGDYFLDSVLLIDRLVNFGPASNQGFELGDFTGYTVYGTAEVVTGATSYFGTPYSPTEGSKMAKLTSNNEDTSEFPGPGTPTNGAYLTFLIDVAEGTTISFDWNFLAFDYFPYEDFAFLFGQNGQNGMGEIVHFEVLAQIIPEPATMLLLGFGLVGLAGFARKKMKK